MQAVLRMTNGKTTKQIEIPFLANGQPLIPADGNTVILDGDEYVVTHTTWNYDTMPFVGVSVTTFATKMR